MSGKKDTKTKKSETSSNLETAKSFTKTAEALFDSSAKIGVAIETRKTAEINLKIEKQKTKGITKEAEAKIHKADQQSIDTKANNETLLAKVEQELVVEQEKIESQERNALDKNEKKLEGIKATAKAGADIAIAEAKAREKESEEESKREEKRLKLEEQRLAAEMADRQAERESRERAFLLTLQAAQQANQLQQIASQQHQMQYLPTPGYPASHGVAPGTYGYAPPSNLLYGSMGAPMSPVQSTYGYPTVTTAGGTPLTPLPGHQANFQPPMPSMPGANPQTHMMSSQGGNPMMGMQPPPGIPYQGPSTFQAPYQHAQPVNPGMVPGSFFNSQRQNYNGQQQQEQQLQSPGSGNIPNFRPY